VDKSRLRTRVGTVPTRALRAIGAALADTVGL
jgi:mRNA-degrading endonuclease toxin of MazEF toxin-antitoxin module